MVWDVRSQARRKSGPASQSDDSAIPTKWSSRLPSYKCSQPRNIEGEIRKKHNVFNSVDATHQSIGKSARCQRSSVELVYRLVWKNARSEIYWKENVHFRRNCIAITTAESARKSVLWRAAHPGHKEPRDIAGANTYNGST